MGYGDPLDRFNEYIRGTLGALLRPKSCLIFEGSQGVDSVELGTVDGGNPSMVFWSSTAGPPIYTVIPKVYEASGGARCLSSTILRNSSYFFVDIGFFKYMQVST